jgi:hypothetical protein
MLAATHAITGAIFASQLGDPSVALAASFVSHPLMDLFPHWDFNTRWADRSYFRIFLLSAFDAGIGFIIGFLIFGHEVHWFRLMSCMLMAQWADWLEAPLHFGFKFPPFTWIKKAQHFWHTKLGWPWGFIPQVAILAFAIYLSKN